MTMAGSRAAISSDPRRNACSPISGRAESNIVVVYKVDRLTRSLADFARLVELFDAEAVSFVSVTQQFNTTSSMGRLTLNVLLSFAQFEREVTGERIRDKIAASKKKGMWMGGNVPLGYDANERTLVINPAEAVTVRRVFALYRELGCVRRVKEEADRLGCRAKCRTTANGTEAAANPSRAVISTHCSRTQFTPAR
jgi:site-specific DNA recombinase